jgi:hypothetical protein
MTLDLTAKPRTPFLSKRNNDVRYEQVDLIDMTSSDIHPEGYCFGVIHIDSFFDKDNSDIYDRLLAGKEVELQIVERKKT